MALPCWSMIARDSNNPPTLPVGFLLVEVVVAIGICAAVAASVVAFLGPAAVAVRAVRDTQDAARVVNAVQSYLQRTPFSVVGSYVANGDVLYASRGGDRIGPYASAAWNDLGTEQALRDREKFFEITLLGNDSLPLSPGALIFTLRLRWPAYAEDGRRVPDNGPRNYLLTPAAVAR